MFLAQQPSQAVSDNVNSTDFGPTTTGPLGWIVHARSGDKGSDANVGFWVRHKDEWEWLRWLLSIATIEHLLADEYKGKRIVSFILASNDTDHSTDVRPGSLRAAEHVRRPLSASRSPR